MANPISAPITDERLSAGGLALLAAAKIGTDQLTENVPILNKLVGNGSIKSGLIKTTVGVAGALKVPNKYLKYACAGVALDGLEDLIVSAISMVRSRSGSSANEGGLSATY